MDSSNDNGNGQQGTSTRPYLIRALHDWCTDNGFTPYLAVQIGRHVQVPMEYANNNEIVLNVGFEATSGLKLGNEFVEFKARFGGVSREICVPVDHVLAIYARENGQGMAFPPPQTQAVDASTAGAGLSAVPSGEPAIDSKPNKPSALPTLRGLRLAGSEVEAAAPAKLAQDEGQAPDNNDQGQGGDEPKPTGPARPKLKRIK